MSLCNQLTIPASYSKRAWHHNRSMPSIDVALKLQHMTLFIALCWFILPSHSSGGVLAASTVFSAAAVMGAGTLCVVSMGSVSDLAYRSTLHYLPKVSYKRRNFYTVRDPNPDFEVECDKGLGSCVYHGTQKLHHSHQCGRLVRFGGVRLQRFRLLGSSDGEGGTAGISSIIK
ncbi:hypothetical protein F5X96DRAFT_616080 [Biscogniauxia mediterranea]|nr:hypothetical protein F5X96DRAFT_616080 [Biscogniauxia mediterranea]